jgi:hypothetical protein
MEDQFRWILLNLPVVFGLVIPTFLVHTIASLLRLFRASGILEMIFVFKEPAGQGWKRST